MKALSLWQPWASAIALGIKHNETRSWTTNHRGPLAIHASRKESPDGRELFEQLMQRGDFYYPMEKAGIHSWSMLPKGAIVAVVNLVDVARTHDVFPNGLEEMLGDYTPGRFAWQFTNEVHALEKPYFIKGAQGLFNVPDL